MQVEHLIAGPQHRSLATDLRKVIYRTIAALISLSCFKTSKVF